MFSGLDTQIQIKDFLWTGSGWFKRHILSDLQQCTKCQFQIDRQKDIDTQIDRQIEDR